MGLVSEKRKYQTDKTVYPIRTKVTDYSKSHGDDVVIGRHSHPGYTLGVPDQARQTPLETYTKSHEYYTNHERLREEFARGMRETRICVFDASLERKMIRKVSPLQQPELISSMRKRF